MVSVTVPDALWELPRDVLQQSLQSQVSCLSPILSCSHARSAPRLAFLLHCTWTCHCFKCSPETKQGECLRSNMSATSGLQLTTRRPKLQSALLFSQAARQFVAPSPAVTSTPQHKSKYLSHGDDDELQAVATATVAGGAAGAAETWEGDIDAVAVDEAEFLRVQELQQKVQALRAQAASQVFKCVLLRADVPDLVANSPTCCVPMRILTYACPGCR